MEEWTQPQFQALLREGHLAASNLGRGATVLGRCTVGATGYYVQAFFDLSIGLERLGKLIYVIHRACEDGEYPSDQELRKLGHGLSSLVDQLGTIRRDYPKAAEPIASGTISKAIVAELSEFATSTRYYNLNYLVGAAGAALGDPIANWRERVGSLILAKHYSARSKAKDAAEAAWVHKHVDPIAHVVRTSAGGTAIHSMASALLHAKAEALIAKYSRMYVLRTVRAAAALLRQVQYRAMERGLMVPYLSELFAIFNNEDRYFLTRKTWDPYNP